ncbi:MAG: hypothetical protein Phyf2KO_00940 [Phycisphaerales bacterium]
MNQGLNWYYSFESGLAKQAFMEASTRDESSPMPWWGISIASGPTINSPQMSEGQSREAWEALQQAKERIGNTTPVEKALIEALEARYAWPAPEDRSDLDVAYADAMRLVHETFPEDPDVATLYAEALLVLRPWDQWAHTGDPNPGTLDALAALERARDLAPGSPGAHHITIHAVEGSRTPQIGIESAQVLEELAPDSAHLLHMPSHIYVRMGLWEKAAESNERANRAIERLSVSRPEMGNGAWVFHHLDFLILVDKMTGDRDGAIRHARAFTDQLPIERAMPLVHFVDPYMLKLPSVYKRFGMWEEIIAYPELPPEFVVSKANLHHMRAVAFSALGDTERARSERDLLISSLENVSEETKWGSSNKAIDVLRVAVPYVDGEIAYREGRLDVAIRKLKEAVELEDQLTYDEPPAWMTPPRHALGAVLLEAGRYSEAESVYQADLVEYPENGWALWGLTASLEGQDKDEEADAARTRQERAWTHATIPLTTSCQCVTPDRDSGE